MRPHGVDPLIREIRVVGQEHGAVGLCPVEYGFVARQRESDLRGVDYLPVWSRLPEPRRNGPRNVLVEEDAEWIRRAGQPSARRRPRWRIPERRRRLRGSAPDTLAKC